MSAPRKPAATAALLAGAAALLAACASDDRGPRRGGGDRPQGPPRARASLFISPAGQPFHAGPGEPYPVVVWFAQADKNHDGKLTREEFRADFEAFFKTLDANHDGVIDGLELADYEQKVAPEILSVLEQPQAQNQGGGQGNQGGPAGGGGRRRGGGFGGGGQDGQGGRAAQQAAALRIQGAAAYSLFNVSEPVAGADADFDGKVTLAEFLAAADRRFDMLDKTGQGYLVLSELPRTPDQIAVEGKKKPPPANP